MLNRDRRVMKEFSVMSPLRYAVTICCALGLGIASWSTVVAQISNPGVQQSGAVTANHCVKWGPGTGQIQDAGGVCAAGVSAANPTATGGPAAVNGVAPTYMRSDASPAIQTGTNLQQGLVQCDGTTISCSAGVISGAAPANPTATAGPAAVNGSAPTFMRSDAAPLIQKGSNSQFGIVESDGVTITCTTGVCAVAAITFGGQTVAPGHSAVVQGNGGKVQLSTGSPVSGNCADFDVNGNVVDAGSPCGGATGANPSATAGATAVNGAATTYMRSDGAPAVQKGTNAQFGIVEGDGATITCVTGVCSQKANTFSATLASSNFSINQSSYTTVTGMSVTQGGTGTFWAYFSAGISDSGGAATVNCRLTDGTTVIDEPPVSIDAVNQRRNLSGGGVIASPAGNIVLQCKSTTTTSVVTFNNGGDSKDTVLTVFRLQ